MRSAWRSPSVWFGLVLGLGLLALSPGGGAQVNPKAASRAVATEHPVVTRAAMELLAQGGNAVDAAITAALVAGVVAPTSSGLGGGGFAMVLSPGATEPEILDFRETAPVAVDVEALARRPLPAEERGKLTGVPGEPQGLFELSRRYGERPWPELAQKAEKLAARGFAVSAYLAKALAGPNAAELQKDASLAALFYPGGRPAIAGRVVRNPKLAGTLKRLAAEGPRPFYDGAIAAELVATAASAGGTLSLADFKAYKVMDRKPIRAQFGEHVVYSMPAPSSGGLLLAQTLGLFTPLELERLGWGSGALTHLLAEAFRASFADRYRYVGDPDLVPVDTTRLLEPARLRRIRQKISLDRTHLVQRFVGEEHGTHHLIVADSDGMVVSLTTTVNRSFGAKLVARDSGIVLNDELDDFTKPSDYAKLGLPHGPNLPRPGARPASSMTPTIALRGGRPVLAIGGSGGMLIATNVAQLAIGRLVFGRSPAELVNHPRFYVSMREGTTLYLDPGSAPELFGDLANRGEVVATMPYLTSGVQIVAGEPGALEAASDPRKQGRAEVAR